MDHLKLASLEHQLFDIMRGTDQPSMEFNARGTCEYLPIVTCVVVAGSCTFVYIDPYTVLFQWMAPILKCRKEGDNSNEL